MNDSQRTAVAETVVIGICAAWSGLMAGVMAAWLPGWWIVFLPSIVMAAWIATSLTIGFGLWLLRKINGKKRV